MFKTASISALLCLLLAPLAMATDILQLSTYHGDEVKSKSGLTWMGLYKSKAGKFELKATKVFITRVYDGIVDQSPKEKTGKNISVPDKIKPDFVFLGISALKSGPVATSAINKREHLKAGDAIKLKIAGSEATLSVSGQKSKTDEQLVTGYTIVIESGGVKQTIFQGKEISAESAPSLLWAGDMDGDGKIDLLMDTTDHYNVENLALFLSSKAKPGKLVQEVASHMATGC